MGSSVENSKNRFRTSRLSKAAVALAALTLVSGKADAEPLSQSAAAAPPPSVYRLFDAYPNFDMVEDGYYLEGVNPYDPNYDSTSGAPARSVLWFEDLGDGRFRQYNTDPTGGPEKRCHWDEHKWEDGPAGKLTYLGTADRCQPNDNKITFRPGLRFMPKAWKEGQEWSDEGLAQTAYFESGVLVCRGINRWRSEVSGVEKGASGPVLHVQINETQSLEKVKGAPDSKACPPGKQTRFNWQENFFFAKQLPVKDPLRTTSPGLVRSSGGNPDFQKKTGHPEWDVRFNSWQRSRKPAQ
jgi:hypothetical protein